ncbi:hypothetical protein [Mycoplasmoides alvi]|uniref:hypothetical protein n=1 Tax=Mycoplasmoides alvi TaxID=78580 RepID=UPI00051B88C0|nr:hypothetical protein [Mycoplasmoides alvi]
MENFKKKEVKIDIKSITNEEDTTDNKFSLIHVNEELLEKAKSDDILNQIVVNDDVDIQVL